MDLSQTILDTWATVANPFGDQRESDAALMRMRTALEAVLVRHPKVHRPPLSLALDNGYDICNHCRQIYPCSTVRAIEAALTADTKGDDRA